MNNSDANPVQILIAEDSPTQAQRLQHILEQQGYGVVHASNGRLALETARRCPPTLIISDVVMPEMDGYELCRSIKSEPALREIPVILVTTMSDPQDVIRGLECRADNFILKPYDADYLLGRIQFVLNNPQMRQAEQIGAGVEIFFAGERHFITASRLQILDLLLSTYDAAMQRNRELSSTQDALRQSNARLKQMTQDLEERVMQRTGELIHANEALQKAYDELRQTQQTMVQQERLRVIGQMASGIAHDINNALSPVGIYAESLLETEPQLSARAREYLETIRHAIEDVAATVARMREFYRHEETPLEMAPVDLNLLIQRVIDLTRARWSDMPQQRGAVVKMQIELAPDLPAVMGVENEVRDALTNLIFNAVDAMPDGGTLTLRTKIVPAGARNGVVIEVADTGIGMDEQTQQRCIEPFFTTKGDRGTGLGLAMVYGMVRRHNARLEIQSVLRTGTTMRLIFGAPAAEARDTAPRPAASGRTAANLRILVIDDDDVLLKSLRETLQTDGHTVVTAGSGQTGVETFRAAQEKHEPFAVSITDLGMPGIDGRRVASLLKEISPATPVILLTGWGQRLLADGDLPPHVDCILSKPPKLGDLRYALAQMTC